RFGRWWSWGNPACGRRGGYGVACAALHKAKNHPEVVGCQMLSVTFYTILMMAKTLAQTIQK
ncbi:hypothetical protein, partial [Xenorhabdus hominickii]|uniref:hypothetical protein n=1 Tax=Xenorhabdus hominickii TaxID=351679 RepID=UPI001B8028BB